MTFPKTSLLPSSELAKKLRNDSSAIPQKSSISREVNPQHWNLKKKLVRSKWKYQNHDLRRVSANECTVLYATSLQTTVSEGTSCLTTQSQATTPLLQHFIYSTPLFYTVHGPYIRSVIICVTVLQSDIFQCDFKFLFILGLALWLIKLDIVFILFTLFEAC